MERGRVESERGEVGGILAVRGRYLGLLGWRFRGLVWTLITSNVNVPVFELNSAKKQAQKTPAGSAGV